MKIHKNAVIRNRPSERKATGPFRWTRCGLRIQPDHTQDRWPGVTCKNCLRTKKTRKKGV